jgi:opacity protein-like surface antigen
MRNFLMAAVFAIGVASAAPATAAPSLAGLDAMTTAAAATTEIEQAQYRDRRFDGRRGVGRYYGPPRRAYGRRFGGPPPHARAYGRRGYDRGYGRRW